MDSSKIHVYALMFMKALKAVLAVAPREEPRDLVQFRVEGESLFISARTMWESITVEVPTSYIDVNYERDGWFEISRGEAETLLAMKIKALDDDDDPIIGLLIRENYIVRTDETGLGLGLRSVKVKRHQPIWEPQLANIPHVLIPLRDETPSVVRPMLAPKQWAMVNKVAAALNTELTVWSISQDNHSVVQNVVTSASMTMSVLCSKMGSEGKPVGSDSDDGQGADYEDVPLFDKPDDAREDNAEAQEDAESKLDSEQAYEEAEKALAEHEQKQNSSHLRVVQAKPPGGLA